MNEKYVPHRFNPQVAELYGINAALIFQYVCFRVRLTSSGWVAMTLPEICKQYPYLGAWQVWRALKCLTNSGRKTPALVTRKMVDGFYRYQPVSRADENLALHTFDVRLAVKLGVEAALVYHNVSFWIKFNWQQKAEDLYGYLNPAEFDDDDFQMQRYAYQMTRKGAAHHGTVKKWVSLHPYISLATAKRAFAILLKTRLFQKGRTQARIPMWFLPRAELTKFEQDMLSHSTLEIDRLKTQVLGSKPKSKAQNPRLRFKTQEELPLTPSGSNVSRLVVEAYIEEAEIALRAKKQIGDHSDAFLLSPSLAVARDGSAGTASNGALPLSPSAEELRRMNCPKQPAVKRKVLQDAFGNPVTRTYVRKPKPDDPEFYAYLDSLTPEKRQAVLAGSS